MGYFNMYALLFLQLFIHISADVSSSINGKISWFKNHPDCGLSASSEDRIVGGKESSLGRYPWLVRIGKIKPQKKKVEHRDFFCSGALITRLYILTASHCSNPTAKLLARLGEHNAATDVDCEGAICAPPVQDITIVNFLMHPKYNDDTVHNDVAVAKLEKPAELTKFVNVICLPHPVNHFTSREFNSADQFADVAGWGMINGLTKEISTRLKFVKVGLWEDSKCISKYREDFSYQIDSVIQFCAGGVAGQDSCMGDSGGPLMALESINPEDNVRFYTIGVVSYGPGECGQKGVPGIYTRLTAFLDWILEHVDKEFFTGK